MAMIFLVQQVVDKQHGRPVITGRTDAQVEQLVRGQVHQDAVDIRERDGLTVGLGSPGAHEIALERADERHLIRQLMLPT